MIEYITPFECKLADLNNGEQYVNRYTDRIKLKEDCTALNRLDIYEKVMKVWGAEPTVEDPNAPKTLDELKQEKLGELETRFTERVKGRFIAEEGYKMQFDVTDSLKMNGAITLMEAVGSTVGYITQANDETVYNVSIETMKHVLIEMLNAYAQCHARKQELRKLINDAQSKEELTEITISWPV